MKVIEYSTQINTLLSMILDDSALSESLSGISGFSEDSFKQEYIDNYSAEKSIIDRNIKYLDDLTLMPFLSNRILLLYKRKWIKLIDTYSIQYDATKPYNMALNDKLKSDNLNSTDTRNGSTTSSGTDTSSYQGFNSDGFSDTDKNTTSDSGTSSSSDTYARQHTSERDITRSGNIGNKTIPQLIQEDREFLKWNLFVEMYKDIDKCLCSRIWDLEIK